MKGVIFGLLQTLVVRDHGEEGWDTVLERAGSEGIYTSLGSYPDRELFALLAETGRLSGRSRDDALRWLGRESLPLLAASYPGFFTPHRDARAFALTVNAIIHPEVRKLYPGADVPEFAFDASVPDRLSMAYRSSRGMCLFGEGLLEGAGRHYGQDVQITQPECTRRGDARCRLQVVFGDASP
jgi:hypothetical protein